MVRNYSQRRMADADPFEDAQGLLVQTAMLVVLPVPQRWVDAMQCIPSAFVCDLSLRWPLIP